MDIQAFSGLFSLSHRVTVYVPGTCGVDTQADTREQVERVAASLSAWFGGATSTPALGYWVSPTAGLVAENTTRVFAYATEDTLKAHAEKLLQLCASIKDELHQESVAFELDGKMMFV